MLVSRRRFLKSSIAVVPAAALMPIVFQRAVAAAVREQGADPAPMGERTLIIVQMAGGNDGLNTVAPVGDSLYYELRGELAIADTAALPLDGATGLHPSLAAFKELWDEGALAVVEGVGYPGPSFSHFQSMDIWQTGDHTGRVLEGWAGRYLNGLLDTQADGLQALSVGRSLPRAMLSNTVAVPMVESVDRYRLQADPRDEANQAARTEALLSLYASVPGAMPYGAVLDNTIQAAQRSSKALQSAHAAYTTGVVYPDTPLGRGLRLIAEAVDADLGLRVGHVRIGGFDTHASQAGAHDELLADTAGSILAFYRDLQAHGRDRNVIIMTWSEFGRRVTANASGGTDHGAAGPMFVAGTPVAGGFYGERPSLSNLVRENLVHTTDFRSVYATVLEGWLGAPADLVLGASYERLAFIKPGALA